MAGICSVTNALLHGRAMKKEPRLERKKTGGRPRKFREPSRPITLTLPESTLAELHQIDPDRSRAIVKLTRNALSTDGQTRPSVEIVEMAAQTGLVIVGPSRALRQIRFLHLVEVAPARYLLALDPGHDFSTLELAINDALDELTQSEEPERELLTALLAQMRRLRKSEAASTAEILLVRLNGS